MYKVAYKSNTCIHALHVCCTGWRYKSQICVVTFCVKYLVVKGEQFRNGSLLVYNVYICTNINVDTFKISFTRARCPERSIASCFL